MCLRYFKIYIHTNKNNIQSYTKRHVIDINTNKAFFNYNSISTRGVPLSGPSRCAVFTCTDTSTFSHSVLTSFIVCDQNVEGILIPCLFSLLRSILCLSLLRPRGLPGSSVGKESACNAGHYLRCRKPRFDP